MNALVAKLEIECGEGESVADDVAAAVDLADAVVNSIISSALEQTAEAVGSSGDGAAHDDVDGHEAKHIAAGACRRALASQREPVS